VSERSYRRIGTSRGPVGGINVGRFVGFVSVLVIASAFSGCMGDADAKEHDHADHDHMESDAMDANAAANATELVAAIAVTIDGNLSEAVNGSIPAAVGTNVTFDGSESVGDNLTFAWDFGDNETGENASETHAFAEPGVFNVTLTVTSGNETDSAYVLVNVTSAAPAAGVIWMDTASFTGTLAVGNPNSAFQANTDYRDHTVTILGADPNGTTVLAKRVRWTLDASGPAAVDLSLYWRKDGANLATVQTSNAADETLAFEGDMVPGEYVIRVRFNAGANASYTVSGEIDYEAV
jgi:hypothetical protein